MKRFVERLHDPYLLDEGKRENFTILLKRRLEQAFSVFARNDYIEGFDMLCDLGFITRENISTAIDIAASENAVASSGHLLQLQFERFGNERPDFEL